MKIVIVGYGKVGETLAGHLSGEHHNVIVIDKDAEKLTRAAGAMDVMCVRGNGASVRVLKDVGTDSADIFISATSLDEMNMVCCLAAKKLGAKYTIARIRDPDYAGEIQLLKTELDIDMVINPEHATAVEISRLLRFSNVIHMDTFYRGRIELVSFRAAEGDPIIDIPLAGITQSLISLSVLFCAIERGDEVIIPDGSTIIKAGDHVSVIGDIMGITKFFKALGRIAPKIKDVLIVGGGRIAHYLTDMLMTTGNMNVKIIEVNPERCAELSESLPDTLIINGDGTDQDLLQSENIASTDAFIAMTNRDEDNIMTALYALQCGLPKVIAKSNRSNYTNVVKNLGLDSVVSPKLLTAGSIINLVRGMTSTNDSVMEAMYKICGGKAEVIEFRATADTKYLRLPIKHAGYKPGILIAAIIRGGKIIIPGGEAFIDQNDSVIIVNKTDGENIIYHLNDIYKEVGEAPI